MFCREIKTLISPYLDGRLDYGQSRLLEEHIASCPTCRYRLGLMEEIPTALQTDRMLAPQPEFTKFVMQQIIVQQQLGAGRIETRLRQVTFQVGGELDQAPSTEDDLAPSQKIVSLASRRPKTPNDYALRFSAVAAVAVVMITAGAFALTQPSNLSDTAAAVYGGIQGFADTVRNAFTNPVDIITGVALSALIMGGLWYVLLRPGRARR